MFRHFGKKLWLAQITRLSDGTSTGNLALPIGALIGDTTADRTVNTTDINQVEALVGQVATSSNFRSDVTADGVNKNPDVSLVKAKKGTVLPNHFLIALPNLNSY